MGVGADRPGSFKLSSAEPTAVRIQAVPPRTRYNAPVMSRPSDRPSLGKRLAGVIDPATLRRWAERPGGSRLSRSLLHQLRIFVLTARRVVSKEVELRAAALTYHTVLSIVPLLAVGFALFKAFGGLRRLEGPLRQIVMENLAVGRAEEVGPLAGSVHLQHQRRRHRRRRRDPALLLGGGAAHQHRELNQSHLGNRAQPPPAECASPSTGAWSRLAPPLVGFSISITTRLQSAEFTLRVLSWLPFGPGPLAALAELGARGVPRLHPGLSAGAGGQGAPRPGPARRPGGRAALEPEQVHLRHHLGGQPQVQRRSTVRWACCRS